MSENNPALYAEQLQGPHVHHRMSATQSSSCARSLISSLPDRQATMEQMQAKYCMTITAQQP